MRIGMGLSFEVEDDGIGMDEAELAAVRAKLTLEPEEELAPIGSGGFGLHNVVQRIQMYYGDQAEILVESEKNIGTCFKVYLGNQKIITFQKIVFFKDIPRKTQKTTNIAKNNIPFPKMPRIHDAGYFVIINTQNKYIGSYKEETV